MRKLVLLGILFLLSGIAYSQPSNSPDIVINPFWDFYAESKLSASNAGKGYTGVASENDLSGITLNPATFEPVNKFQVIGSYDIKSSIPWYFSSDMYLKTIHPTVLAGVGYKVNDKFSVGLLYYNKNSFKLDLGEIIETDEFGNIIGRTSAYERYATNNFTVPLVYKSRYIKAGVNLNAVYYKGYIKYSAKDSNNFSTGFWKFIPDLGVVVSPIESFSFGATFSPSYQHTMEWTSENNANSFTYNTANNYPANFTAGTELRLINKKLIFDLDYRFSNNSIIHGQKDRHNMHFGAEYSVIPELKLRAGFFTSLDYREGSYLEEIGKYDSYFITLGGTYKYKGYSFSLAFMNNDIIKSTTVSYTRLGATISYDFDFK